MKTALITGVAGFIGSSLAEKLLKDNFKVIGIDTIKWYLDHEDYWKDTPSSIFNPTPWKN